jgi:hypothetical protein
MRADCIQQYFIGIIIQHNLDVMRLRVMLLANTSVVSVPMVHWRGNV